MKEVFSSDEEIDESSVTQALRLAHHNSSKKLRAKVKVLQSAILIRLNAALRRKLCRVTIVESSSDTTSESESESSSSSDSNESSSDSREEEEGLRKRVRKRKKASAKKKCQNKKKTKK